MESKYLTTEDVAVELDVNVSTVRRWIISGDLRAKRAGHQHRILREDLEAYLERGIAVSGDR